MNNHQNGTPVGTPADALCHPVAADLENLMKSMKNIELPDSPSLPPAPSGGGGERSRVYIAGKVTGLPPAEVEAKFSHFARLLRQRGYAPLNPMRIVTDPHTSWPDAMKACIAAMLSSDAVLALPCWNNSSGALLELYIARQVGIPIACSLTELAELLRK